MFDRGDLRSFQASSEAGFGAGRSGRDDAEFAISMLGPKAAMQVPTATAMHFGQWLGWPEWLREGTSLGGTGPLPPVISLADDLVIIGNIIDHADSFALIARMLFSPQPVMGTTGALSLMHAPDIGHALQAIVRAIRAQNPFLIIDTQQVGEELHITFEPPWPMGPLFRFSAIAGLALIYRALEGAVLHELADATIATQLHDVPEAQAMLANFQCRIVPGSRTECLRLPVAWTTLTNPHHDPLIWAVANSKLTELERQTSDPEIITKLRDFIVDMLQNQRRVPRLKQATAHLGMSSRTIVRLLAKHDTSFHRMVESERKAMALLVIADQSISLADAARRLGFSDMSSFGRSVRLWFGCTPAMLRKSWSSPVARAS